jgi:hypothetical protein
MINNLRTQILLPAKLRQEIEGARRAMGESLAEYLREAAKERLAKRQEKKADLALLARKIRTVGKSGWEGLDVVQWQRAMREDREA